MVTLSRPSRSSLSALKAADGSIVPELLSIAETQVLLGVGRTTIEKLVRDGAFPTVRIGRAVRVQRKGVMRWIDEQAG